MIKSVYATSVGPAKDVLKDREIAAPELTKPHDLLVRVKAVSVNPVDYKVRTGMIGEAERQLGYDAAGVVEAIGSEVSLFKVGDEVMYAGDLMRDGTNAELHLVDERIVGKKPSSFSFAEAAAVPLVALTAWEGLIEGCAIPEQESSNKNILVVAGAGGVGSVAIQIAKKVLGLTVIATASRPETTAFVKEMGADFVINHRNPYADELKALDIKGVDYVMNCIDVDKNFDQLAEILNPFGRICAITHAGGPIDVSKLFMKRGSLVWEIMFARSMTGVDMENQHHILNRMAELIDSGNFKTTVTKALPFNAASLIEAHEHQESGKAIGKTVLEL